MHFTIIKIGLLVILRIGDTMRIYKNVDKNIEYIKNINHNSSDIVSRIITNNDIKIAYVYLESVTSDDKVSEFLNKSIIGKDIKIIKKNLESNIYNSHITTLKELDNIFYYLSSGFTVIFIDNYDICITVETRMSLDRGVSEATSEPIVRGPKDSFTENNAINLGLIRKRIKDENLIFDEVIVGKRTKTKVSVAYIKDVVKLNSVIKVIDKIKNIDIDGILDSGYIREFLYNQSSTVFPRTISTERPDLAASSLLEGKIVILVENSPYVLILPGLFIDFFHSPEDNYQKPINASFLRLLRILCFFITICVPSLYVALMTFNPEIIPDDLLISLALQRDGVPFPTALEILIFVIIFEILRQADIHSPTVSGSAMNIVGALVLGDAAVNAVIVSPIAIIIVAITSICELVFYDIDMINAVRFWRIVFIIAALFLGIIGFVSILFIFITKLASIVSFDTPYLTPISPVSITGIKNSLLRIKRDKLFNRPKYLSNNTRKMVDHEKIINNN